MKNIKLLLLALGVIILGGAYYSVKEVYLDRSGSRFYASVTGFEHQLDSIDIGSGSQVDHSALRDRAFVIKPTKHGYDYRVNRDTCLYYKVNNVNPNKHALRQDCSIKLRLDAGSEITLDGSQVIDHLKQYEDQEYFMLSAVYASMNRGAIDRNSTLGKLREHNHSFIHHHRGKDDFTLIILDSMTYLQTTEAIEGYKYEGEVKDKKDLKVQFLSMHSWERMANEKYLSDNTKSYYAKPYVLLTAWGAGHFLFTQRTDEHAKRHIRVHFPKAITTVIDVSNISAEHDRGGLAVFLEQLPKEGYVATDYYIPPFSNLYLSTLLELTKVPSDTLIFPNNLDTLQIRASEMFDKVSNQVLDFGSGKVFLHYAHLDARFFSLKFIALAVVFILLILGIGFYQYKSLCKLSTNEKVKFYVWYSCVLFCLLAFYLCQRFIVADKLSFSYPFFENLYPVTLIVVFGILLSMSNVFMLIARGVYKANGYKDPVPRWIPLASFLLGVLIFLVIVWYSYATFVEPIQSSYLSEVKSSGLATYLNLYHLYSAVISGDLATYLEDNHLFSALAVSWVWLLTSYLLLREEISKGLTEKKGMLLTLVGVFSIACINYTLVGSFLGFFGIAIISLLVFGLMVVDIWREKIMKALANCKETIKKKKENVPVLDKESTLLLNYKETINDTKGQTPNSLKNKLMEALPNYKKSIKENVLIAKRDLKYSYEEMIKGVKEVEKIKKALDLWTKYRTQIWWLVIGSIIGVPVIVSTSSSAIAVAALLLLSVQCFLFGLDNVKGYRNKIISILVCFLVCTAIIIIVAMLIAFVLLRDTGFLIYLFGVPLAGLLVFLYLCLDKGESGQFVWPASSLGIYILLPFVLSFLVKSCDGRSESYERWDRRVQNFVNPESVRSQGYAHTEADRQWLDLMFFYATGGSQEEGKNGFYDEHKRLHPLVSTGQSPVVLNDMSLPAAYISPMGIVWAKVFIIGPLVVMLIIVFCSTVYSKIKDDEDYMISRFPLVLRIVALFLWMGVSVYIMLSFFEQVPYTGRLIPGFGVDSWNEVIEVIIFFSAMGYFTGRELKQ